jgi:membrane-associated phospholipid phosphatase
LKKYLKSTLFALVLSTSALRSDSVKTSGDVLLVAIPTLSFLYSYYQDDRQGQVEIGKSLLATTLTTYALKFSIKEERPNHKNNRSFPSGHSAITFASASYLHKRYGLKSAVPAYLGATWTAYSRVESKYHYTKDVIAGALIGTLSSYFLTTKFDGTTIRPIFTDKQLGISFFKSF